MRTFGDNFGNKSGVFQLLTRRIPKSDIKNHPDRRLRAHHEVREPTPQSHALQSSVGTVVHQNS